MREGEDALATPSQIAVPQRPAVTDRFRCPECGGRLAGSSTGRAFACQDCSSEWPVIEGIPCFVPANSLPAYQLSGSMAELVTTARATGWRKALEQHLSEVGARKDYAEEYVGSEARGDFRFLTSVNCASTVLDIGSGWGNIAVAFARTAKQVYALDTTLANVQFVGVRAQQEGLDNVTPVMGDAVKLPLPPSSCDVVLMVGVLEWVPWGRDDGSPRDLQQRALENVAKVLKPGGQLYIGIENRFSIKSFMGYREPHTGLRFISLMPRRLADWYSRVARRAPFREWTYSRRQLRQLLRAAGFTSVREYYPLPSYQNFRFITDFGEPWLTRFLVDSYRGFGSFNGGIRAAGLVASLLRIEKTLSPCFSFIAEKSIHD